MYMFQVKVPLDAKPTETVVFRTLLLNRCQREFEKDKDEEEEMAQRQQAIDAADNVCSLIVRLNMLFLQSCSSYPNVVSVQHGISNVCE